MNWDEVLVGATAVVSTLGGFGSEEQMQRINGEANVVSVNAAKEYGKEMFNSHSLQQTVLLRTLLLHCFCLLFLANELGTFFFFLGRDLIRNIYQ